MTIDDKKCALGLIVKRQLQLIRAFEKVSKMPVGNKTWEQVFKYGKLTWKIVMKIQALEIEKRMIISLPTGKMNFPSGIAFIPESKGGDVVNNIFGDKGMPVIPSKKNNLL